MNLTWTELAVEKPKFPGQVALTYHPTKRPGQVVFDVLVWSVALGKGGAFGRMKVGKRFTTIEHVAPEPTHWAPIGPDFIPMPK